MATTNSFNVLLLFIGIIILLNFNLHRMMVIGASIRYDQSQFGDYNVQIHLKNIELYAILAEEILNSEYDYDYSELTEKPSVSSSIRPGTALPNVTTATKPTTVNKISEHSQFNFGSDPSNNSLSSIKSSAMAITNQLLATPESMNVTLEHKTIPLKIEKCASGYYRDILNRCRRLRKPHIPFLQMVHTLGVIKSFQQPTEQSTTPPAIVKS